jgi:hypothetical protein
VARARASGAHLLYATGMAVLRMRSQAPVMLTYRLIWSFIMATECCDTAALLQMSDSTMATPIGRCLHVASHVTSEGVRTPCRVHRDRLRQLWLLAAEAPHMSLLQHLLMHTRVANALYSKTC